MRSKEVSLYLVILSIWVMTAPVVFGFTQEVLRTSDCIAGILLLLTAVFAYRRFHWISFALFCAIGVWLPFSPLLFWATDRGAFINGIFTGFLTLTCAFHLLPLEKKGGVGSETPEGWNFNPSAWSFRLPILLLGLACYLMASYLASFQLGFINSVWDPLFGLQTAQVLHSKTSQAFPVSDAGLGALSYLLEIFLCWQGSSVRWKTHPWLVLSFGFLAVPASIVSIVLIILQPLAVGAWCFLCLTIGVCMLIVAVSAIPEVVATLLVLRSEKRKGLSPWKAILYGSSADKVGMKTKVVSLPRTAIPGIVFSWSALIQVVLGVGIILAASFLELPRLLIDSSFVFGPLIIVFAVMAFSIFIQTIDRINALFGLALLLIAISTLSFASGTVWLYMVCGLLLIALPFWGRIRL